MLKFKKISTSPARVIIFCIFFLFAFSNLYVLIWALSASLKDAIEYVLKMNTLLPEKWLFGNYLKAFDLLSVNDTNLFGMLFNTIWLALGNATISMVVCCTTSYIMAKYTFKGKKIISYVIIFALIIPIYGSSSATLKFYFETGIYDSPWILVTAASGIGGMYLMLNSYWKGVSWEYAEAAKMDGASEFTTYVKIMVPIAMPCISSLYMIMLINGWNDWSTSIYYLPSYPTIAAGLYLYKNISLYNMDYPVYFAGVLLSCIPTFIVFIVFQEKIISNISMGGLKG